MPQTLNKVLVWDAPTRVIYMLLVLTLLVNGAGWLYLSSGIHALKEVHEGAASAMLGVVGVHVAGVALASLQQRENLAKSMLDGRKRVAANEAVRWSWWPRFAGSGAGILVAAMAKSGF